MQTFVFTHDELVLMMIGLVRATHPSMLRAESDGFSFDFRALDSKQSLDADEQLIFKLRAVLDSPVEQPSHDLQLDSDESRRIVTTLTKLQRVQPWPADVTAMCNSIRTRLNPGVAS